MCYFKPIESRLKYKICANAHEYFNYYDFEFFFSGLFRQWKSIIIFLTISSANGGALLFF